MDGADALKRILEQTRALQARLAAAGDDEIDDLGQELAERNASLHELFDSGAATLESPNTATIVQEILALDAETRTTLQQRQRQLLDQLNAAQRAQAATKSYSDVQDE